MALALVTLEFGLLSVVEAFPAMAWLHRQIYNVDKSLYRNNLQSFNALFFYQKRNKFGGQRESAIQRGSAILFSFSNKINMIRLDIWAII